MTGDERVVREIGEILGENLIRIKLSGQTNRCMKKKKKNPRFFKIGNGNY